MKIQVDFNSRPECCDSNQPFFEGSESGCTRKCRNRAISYLLLAGASFLLLFALGYYIPSSITRVIWLIISGTLMVLTGISVVVVVQCTKPVTDNEFNSEESNSKNSDS